MYIYQVIPTTLTLVIWVFAQMELRQFDPYNSVCKILSQRPRHVDSLQQKQGCHFNALNARWGINI